MTLRSAEPGDLQPPRIASVQPYATTGGPEAAEIARRAGVALDPWQLYGLDVMLGQDADGDWAAAETCAVAGRQTGKNGLIEPVELYGLFILGEQILHTAHRLSASRGSHDRLWRLICADPVLRRRVEQRRTANEEQSILLDDGAKIEFTVRSDEGPRSRTYDRVVIDEGFAATEGHLGGLLPTLISKSMWQINWLSSAGMAKSLPLHDLRRRAIAGEAGLTYLEWSADPQRYEESPERARRDPQLLRQALPALGGRLRFETIEKLAGSLPAPEFDREVLCIWDEPELVEKWSTIGEAQWSAQADHTGRVNQPVAFAIETTPDRSRTAIGMVGWRTDGRGRGVEVVEDRPGTAWVAARAAELKAKWRPVGFALDAAGPSGSLVEALRRERVEVTSPTSRQLGQALGAVLDGVTEHELWHRDDQRLTDAVESLGVKAVGDANKPDRRGSSPIHTFNAVLLADWLLRSSRRRSVPAPVTILAGGSGSADADDVATMGF